MIPVNDLRQGVVFLHEDKIFQVKAFARHKMARAKGIVNVTAVDLEHGGHHEITFKSNDQVEEADLERKKLRFIYQDHRNNQLVFSDSVTQKRVVLDKQCLSDDQAGYLCEGVELNALVKVKDKEELYLTIELPKVVEMKVKSAPPNDKGDTSSGGTKPVDVESGIAINTPFFIQAGDIIKVNTDTGEYMGRI